MASGKYYVVWHGRETGIFDSWEQCRKSVQGHANARYKSYPTLEAAQKAFTLPYQSITKEIKDHHSEFIPDLSVIIKKHKKILCVDAACKGNPGIMEYRGVWLHNREEVFRMGPYPQGTVNIGEFLAIVHGLAFLKRQELDCPVFSDSKTAMKWIHDKKTKTLLEKNDINQILFQLIERAENWLQQNDYPNKILKWPTDQWGEIPADFGRK